MQRAGWENDAEGRVREECKGQGGRTMLRAGCGKNAKGRVGERC